MPSTPRMLQIEAKASQPGEPLTQAEVTAELVRSILDYDPETGVFTWRVRDVSLFPAGKASPEHKAAVWNKRWPGTTAGTPGTGGYVLIAIRDRLYKAHRLAWLYMYGRWPIAFIDHINGDTSDNRLANLREATRAQNSQNRAKQKTATSSRYLGVSWVSSKKKWSAEIMVNNRSHRIGLYDQEEDAAAAYLRAKERLHEFQPSLRDSLIHEYPKAIRYLDSTGYRRPMNESL